MFVCIVIFCTLYIFNCTQTSSSFYCSASVGIHIVNTLACLHIICKRKDKSGFVGRTAEKYLRNYAFVVKTPEEK